MHHANFQFISSNYDFRNTILKDKVIPHKVFNKDGIKVGVFGIGIELKGLVDPKLYGNTQYFEPISVANKKASYLKKKLNCDLVICLSHLGFKYKNNKVSDMKLATQTKNIDFIVEVANVTNNRIVLHFRNMLFHYYVFVTCGGNEYITI